MAYNFYIFNHTILLLSLYLRYFLVYDMIWDICCHRKNFPLTSADSVHWKRSEISMTSNLFTESVYSNSTTLLKQNKVT